MINIALSVTNQMSAAFVKLHFSSWTLSVFISVGRDITQTMHSKNAWVSEVSVMWRRGTKVVGCVLYTVQC